MILVSYSLVTASKRDNEQDLWLSYMITAMHSLVAASKRDWELVLPKSRTRASIGAILRCEEGAYYGLHPGNPMYSQFEWCVVRVWCVLTIVWRFGTALFDFGLCRVRRVNTCTHPSFQS